MRATLAALWILTLFAAFAAGRWLDADGVPAAGDALDFRAALDQADPLERSLQLGAFLDQLGPDDVPGVLEEMRDPEIPMSRDDVRLLMVAWSRFDPEGAYRAARGWPTPWRTTLENEAVWAWGFRDGPAAIRFLESQEDAELVARLRPSLVEGWLRGGSRAQAATYIAQLDDLKRRRRLTFRLAGELARQGVDPVMRWAEGVPEDAPNHYKSLAFYNASSAVARTHPERAAEWYLSHRPHPYSSGALVVIARKWAHHHDANALFEWLMELPSAGERQNERSDAIAAGFSTWYKRAPDDAVAWLETVPEDPVFDAAIAELVRNLSRTDPARAIVWARHIQDETQQRRSTQLAGRRWAGRNPAAARAWLAEHGVSEELSQSILRKPQAPPKRPRAAAPPAEPSAL